MKSILFLLINQSRIFSAILFLYAIQVAPAQDTTFIPDGNTLRDKNYQQILSAGSGNHLPVQNPELPKIKKGDIVVRHAGYTVCYNRYHLQADWIAYELTAKETVSAVERTDQFVRDPGLPDCPVTNTDYRKSGYDKGHLAPAADLGYSEQTMAESFYFSNISPQKPAFNRGIWKKLESQVRQWAIDEEAICIATGGILTAGLPAIGKSQISVPAYFYKVILDYTPPVYKGIAFIMPNEGSTLPLQRYIVTIDSVERATGINFFNNIPAYLQRVVESTSDPDQWSWSVVLYQEGTGKEE